MIAGISGFLGLLTSKKDLEDFLQKDCSEYPFIFKVSYHLNALFKL